MTRQMKKERMHTPFIQLEKVDLTLPGPEGKVDILKKVSLTVNAGEKLAVMGRSGSGKTSLLLVLSGLERATAGRITVAGHEVTALDEDALALFRRDAVGIVFQNFHLVPGMTALENVALPLEFAGARDTVGRAHAALGEVGLAHRLGHFPAQLSGGEQQRVALARAFVTKPRLLLADEPTGNLDGQNAQQIMQLMFALHARHGTTLMLVTHDESVASRCDRTVTLSDGALA